MWSRASGSMPCCASWSNMTVDPKALVEAARVLEVAPEIVMTCHLGPDGDALGRHADGSAVGRVPCKRPLEVPHHRRGADRTLDDERRAPAVKPAGEPEIRQAHRVIEVEMAHQDMVDAAEELERAGLQQALAQARPGIDEDALIACFDERDRTVAIERRAGRPGAEKRDPQVRGCARRCGHRNRRRSGWRGRCSRGSAVAAWARHDRRNQEQPPGERGGGVGRHGECPRST